MDKDMTDRIIKVRQLSTRPFEVTVAGNSMNPVLYEGDIVTIKQMPEYEPGDILVYKYKNEGLLAHRLLDIKNEKYFCKGDNSFRLEDIDKGQIIGKIINAVRDGVEIFISPCSKVLLTLSKAVNREFVKQRYNVQATKMSAIYILYRKIILNHEGDNIVLYKKNESMDYIVEDEQNLVIFDPDSGNTHFVDETGIDILKLLEMPLDIDGIINRLVEMYDASAGDIRGDVEEFLADLIAKKVVEVL